LISNFVGYFVSYIAMRVWFSDEVLIDLLSATYVYMVCYAMDIVWIIIAVLMVTRISQFQETKYKLISSNKSG